MALPVLVYTRPLCAIGFLPSPSCLPKFSLCLSSHAARRCIGLFSLLKSQVEPLNIKSKRNQREGYT